jgi:hypothetical protein
MRRGGSGLLVGGGEVNWRQKIQVAYPDKPQNSVRCQMALRELDSALQSLASLGFPLHIVEGPLPVELPEWPKVVFHWKQGSREVFCQGDLDDLGADWHPTLEAAQYAAGMRKQMERGGIFSENLPATTDLVQYDEDKVVAMSAGRRIRAERRALPAANYPVPALVMPGVKQ